MRISCWSSYVCSSYLPACESREVVIPAKAGIQCPWLLCTLTAEPTALDDIRLRFRHRAGNDDPKRRSARHQRGTIDLPPIPEAAVSNPPANLQRLLDIMARLRDRENGCPWDIEQTFATIAPYTIEEAYEVADAIDRDDLPALKDELGEDRKDVG